MNLQCSACGKRFRSMASEAKHRHNFPAFCDKSSKRWAEHRAEVAEAGYNAACDRLFDVLLGQDGEAFFQAERFLKANRPDLYERLGDANPG